MNVLKYSLTMQPSVSLTWFLFIYHALLTLPQVAVPISAELDVGQIAVSHLMVPNSLGGEEEAEEAFLALEG